MDLDTVGPAAREMPASWKAALEHPDYAGSDRSPARTYLREIDRLRLLKREEEIALGQRIRLGQARVQELVQKISEILKRDQNATGRDSATVKPEGEGDIEVVMAILERYSEDSDSHPGDLRDLMDQMRDAWSDIEAAKSEMIVSNLRLVVKIARSYAGQGLSFQDLVQEGNLGLMQAVERYDDRKGFKFSTYASWWIRQAMMRALSEKARAVRIPVNVLATRRRILQVSEELLEELHREPLPEEIAEKTGLTPERVEEVAGVTRRTISLDTPISDGETEFINFVQAEPPEHSHGDVVEGVDLSEKIRALLAAHLAPREQAVLRLRFGIDEPQHRTLEEVATRFAISRERVRQIERRALEKLRSQPSAKRLLASLFDVG